jgi:hypothetical protein
MWNQYFVRKRSGRARLVERFVWAITFDPPVGSGSKFCQEFPEALLHGLDVESILD